MKKEQIAQLLTDREKDALAVLIDGGFMALTECRLEDVRELDTGLRRPTWRNQGRYDLVVAMKNLAERSAPRQQNPGDEETATEQESEVFLPDVADMKKADLVAEVKDYPEISVAGNMKVDELRTVVQGAREKRRELLTRQFELEG